MKFFDLRIGSDFMNMNERYVNIINEVLFLAKSRLSSSCHLGSINIYKCFINNEKNKSADYYNYIKNFVRHCKSIGINKITYNIEPENTFEYEICNYIIEKNMNYIIDCEYLKISIVDILKKYAEVTENDQNRIEDMVFEFRKCVYEIEKIYKEYHWNKCLKNDNLKKETEKEMSYINVKNIYKINDFSDEEIIYLIHTVNIPEVVLSMLDGKKCLSVIDKLKKKDLDICSKKADEVKKLFFETINKTIDIFGF